MNRTIIASILMAVTIAVVHGKTPATHRADKKVSAEQKQEFWNWYQTTVYPTLKQWHDDYNTSLSSADLATLNNLRAQARQHRLSLKAKAKQLKQNSSSRTDKKEALQELRSEMKLARTELAKQLQPIMERSKEKLTSILQANQATIEAWRKEASEKFSKLPKGAPMLNGGNRKAAARFVLWDGAMPKPLSTNNKSLIPSSK